MFLGRHERGLDSKGRLILPAAHRDALGDDSAIVTYGLDHCLFVFPSTQFEVWRQKIRDLPLTDPLGRLLRRHIFSAADEVTPDGQGRINLLPHLRTYAGLDGQVIIAGMDNYIEIWNAQRWAEMEAISTASGDNAAAWAALGI